MTSRFERKRMDDSAITERVVKISRVSKVVKGGRNLTFSAIVVVGDNQGNVGIGMGKAAAVPDAVKKGAIKAESSMINVPLKDSTIPHEIVARYGASEVMLRPAPPGTGVIAGGAVRAVVELAGVKDIVTKSRRSTNPINTVKAAFKCLSMLRDVDDEIAKRNELSRLSHGK
jgi:small subunit ribosomal protein S5